ncbi:hypothetical protein OH77DRAFT_1425932 [Trametes cingulata]|nr:hypothetical protein OH77DRAFT_1425932 [Trametes cingulata]
MTGLSPEGRGGILSAAASRKRPEVCELLFSGLLRTLIQSNSLVNLQLEPSWYVARLSAERYPRRAVRQHRYCRLRAGLPVACEAARVVEIGDGAQTAVLVEYGTVQDAVRASLLPSMAALTEHWGAVERTPVVTHARERLSTRAGRLTVRYGCSLFPRMTPRAAVMERSPDPKQATAA